MLLHSLKVAGLRCFRNPVVLDDFDEGINIISGPNEAGKSTLMWGLILAFCNRHDVGGEGILAYRPWGTDLSPTVEVEFTAGGKRYYLEKGFLDQGKCILSERTGESYLRLADGKKADDRVRQFMLGRFPGRGLAKGPDWGLAHLLWMPQDKERFASPSVSRQVEDHFRQAVGATLFTARDDRLLELIDNRYAQVFTPKTGQILTKSELNQARIRRQELEDQLRQAREKLKTIASQVKELEAKEKQARQCNNIIAELTDKWNLLSAQVEEVKKLTAQIATAEAEQKVATERWRSLKQDWEHIKAWAQKGEDAAHLLQDKSKELALIKPVVQDLQQQVTVGQAQVDKLTEEVKLVTEQLSRVYKIKQSQTTLAEITKLEQDVEVTGRLQEELAALQQELSLQLLPSADHLAEAEKWQRQIDIFQGQARAQGIQVDFQPVREFVLMATTAEGEKEHRVTPEHPLSLGATGADMKLDIAGVGVFNIRSGAVELKEIISKLVAAKASLAAILQTYQVDGVTELRAKYDWAQNRKQRIKDLQTKRLDILGSRKSEEQLKQQMNAKKQQLNQQCQELGVNSTDLSSISVSDAAQVEIMASNVQRLREEAQSKLNTLRQEFQKQAFKQKKLEQEVSEYERLIETACSEQQKRLTDYGGEKEQLQQSFQRAEAAQDQRTKELEQLIDRLSPDAGSLKRAVARQKQELDLKQQDALKLREEIAGLRAKVNLQSQEGWYSKISKLEEEYELVQSQYSWLAGQARAVKLLHRLVHARHETMLTGITDPIRQGMNGLFQRVTSHKERSLQLDADLSLVGIKVTSQELLQPLEVFSIGAQEQMLLLARLALAHFLSADERQLVVLDDALVNSDGPRRERILSLLAEAADQRLQLVILTCHPDMYQQLPGRRYSLSG